MKKKKKKGKKILIFLVFAPLALAFFGLVVMWLWNWLMPDLFGLSYITFWQAVGLLILSKILFSGIGNKHGSHDSKCKKKSKMPPEERARLKEKFYDKWYRHCHKGSAEEETGTGEASEVIKDNQA